MRVFGRFFGRTFRPLSDPRVKVSGPKRGTMTEDELIALLEKIQALHERAGTEGERGAAAAARDRIRNRLESVRRDDLSSDEIRPSTHEIRLACHDPWGRRLLLALLRRHGVRPYRYPRQHRTTIMIRATEEFVDGELWPEFTALHRELSTYLGAATDRIIATAVHPDSSEAEEVEEARRLSGQR